MDTMGDFKASERRWGWVTAKRPWCARYKDMKNTMNGWERRHRPMYKEEMTEMSFVFSGLLNVHAFTLFTIHIEFRPFALGSTH